MPTTIDATALFFGAPASLTVGGVEVGATLTPPKVTVQATQYAPDFQGAGGPISGAVFNTKIKTTAEFDVNEITLAKLQWDLPGSLLAGTPPVWSWNIGRVPTTDFKDVILDGVGLDGRHLVVTVKNALSDGSLVIEMSDSAVIGAHVMMTGYYDGTDPTLAPITIVIS
jgi:hypothetical protein